LATELAQNTISPIVGASGGNDGWAYQAAKQGNAPTRAFGRSSVGSEDRLYRVEVSAISLPRYPQVRRSNREYIVSYKELNSTLARINKLGGKVASITIAQ
jgi:phycocyanin-associated rod linker protein